jgi:hypothetical protein
MDPRISDLLIVVFAVSIPSAAGVFAYWLRLRAQRLIRHDVADELQEVRSEMEALRTELGGQIAELHERVDFAERLLAQSRLPEQLPPPAPNPTGAP